MKNGISKKSIVFYNHKVFQTFSQPRKARIDHLTGYNIAGFEN